MFEKNRYTIHGLDLFFEQYNSRLEQNIRNSLCKAYAEKKITKKKVEVTKHNIESSMDWKARNKLRIEKLKKSNGKKV